MSPAHPTKQEAWSLLAVTCQASSARKQDGLVLKAPVSRVEGLPMTAGAASAKLTHRAAWSRAQSTQMQTAPFDCPPSLGGRQPWTWG